MDVPAYQYPDHPEPEREQVDNPEDRYPFAHETLTTGIRDATLSGQLYLIKGWIVYATSVISALPNEADTVKAIQNLDLLVAVDVLPTELAGWADVVLPECTYLERYDDLNVELFREPFVALRQPVVAPPHSQKPGWWIARELAVRLGLASYYPWTDIKECLGARMSGAGHSLAELEQKGIIHGEPQPTLFEEGVAPYFPTTSGRIEFYSTDLRDKGFDPVPRYTRPAPPPEGMFRLIVGRSPVHTSGRTQSNPILNDMAGENGCG